jgi:hypothetical protein
MEKECLCRKAAFLKVRSQPTDSKEKALCLVIMEKATKANGKIIKSMGKDNMHGQMAIHTRDSINRIRDKDMV